MASFPQRRGISLCESRERALQDVVAEVITKFESKQEPLLLVELRTLTAFLVHNQTYGAHSFFSNTSRPTLHLSAMYTCAYLKKTNR